MLAGDAVEDFGVVVRGLRADLVHRHAGVAQGLPQGIAISAGRFHRRHQRVVLAQFLEPLSDQADLLRLTDLPGAVHGSLRIPDDHHRMTFTYIQTGPDRAFRQP